MSLTENSDQVFLPGGCDRTQNLRFGPYTIIFILTFIERYFSWLSKNKIAVVQLFSQFTQATLKIGYCKTCLKERLKNRQN